MNQSQAIAMLNEIRALAECGMSHGLLADDYCRQIITKCDEALAATAEVEDATCQVDYLRANFTPFYLLTNARRITSAEFKRAPNWVLAKNLFAIGSNSAHAICVEAGIDPDAAEVRRAAIPPAPQEKE